MKPLLGHPLGVDEVRVQGATPAELGILLDLRPRRRHLAAAVLDLGQRGHLRLRLTVSGSRWERRTAWVVEPAPRPVWFPAGGLRPHEVRVLDLFGGARDDVEGLVTADGLRSVLPVLRRDAVQRGWLHPTRLAGTPLLRRTAAGRTALSDLRIVRSRTSGGLADVSAAEGLERAAELLPSAVALGVRVPWDDLHRRHAPLPRWFTPGPAPDLHGWSGLRLVVEAVSTKPSRGWNWEHLDVLGSW